MVHLNIVTFYVYLCVFCCNFKILLKVGVLLGTRNKDCWGRSQTAWNQPSCLPTGSCCSLLWLHLLEEGKNDNSYIECLL